MRAVRYVIRCSPANTENRFGSDLTLSETSTSVWELINAISDWRMKARKQTPTGARLTFAGPLLIIPLRQISNAVHNIAVNLLDSLGSAGRTRLRCLSDFVAAKGQYWILGWRARQLPELKHCLYFKNLK